MAALRQTQELLCTHLLTAAGDDADIFSNILFSSSISISSHYSQSLYLGRFDSDVRGGLSSSDYPVPS